MGNTHLSVKEHDDLTRQYNGTIYKKNNIMHIYNSFPASAEHQTYMNKQTSHIHEKKRRNNKHI
jgi:hypothetical protein